VERGCHSVHRQCLNGHASDLIHMHSLGQKTAALDQKTNTERAT
jgi:hypothetical protein